MNQTDRELSFRTQCDSRRQRAGSGNRAVVAPVTLASTFVLPGPGVPCEYDYSRTKNPTRFAFENTSAISNRVWVRWRMRRHGRHPWCADDAQAGRPHRHQVLTFMGALSHPAQDHGSA